MLDNPVWSALTTEHVPLARGSGLARRYASDVSPLSALREPSAEAFADLALLAPPGEGVALVTTAEVELPEDWRLVFDRWIDQMVYEGPAVDAPEADLLTLGEADAPEMHALAKLTEPGPFELRTLLMGRYVGIRVDGRLAAMAGERLRLPDATEISAVCTHPDFQGRGYGRLLMTAMLARITGQGRQPFLHVKTENGAKQLYERLGLRVRREMRLTVFAQDASSGPNDSSVG
jgi:ribosomal protein S18 acetylase RimI-like enzyme